MSYYAHAFTGRLETHALGTYTYRVVFLPSEIEAVLPRTARLRFEGEIADVPVEAAWQPAPGRGKYVMVSPELCRTADLAVGDLVEVRFNLVDPDRVEVPEDLLSRLKIEPDLFARWEALPPGKKRGLVHLIAGSKTAETRRRRVEDVAERVRTGERLSAPSKSRRTRDDIAAGDVGRARNQSR